MLEMLSKVVMLEIEIHVLLHLSIDAFDLPYELLAHSSIIASLAPQATVSMFEVLGPNAFTSIV